MSPTRSTEERPMVDFRKLPTRQEDVPIYRLHKEVPELAYQRSDPKLSK